MLGKIPVVRADAVVVDLEDGVAPDQKAAARDNVARASGEGLLASASWMLRVNAADSAEYDRDLETAASVQAPTVLVPKAESPEAVNSLAGVTAGWDGTIALMIETAAGVRRAAEMAVGGSVIALVVGSADLQLSLGARPDVDRRWEALALGQILLAAREAGCAAIDSVYFKFRDAEGLRRHARIARDLGYDGKSCIHPAQVEPIHEIYTSTAEEVEWAHRILCAWQAAGGEGRAVLEVEGEMIEALHLDIARRLLSRAPQG